MAKHSDIILNQPKYSHKNAFHILDFRIEFSKEAIFRRFMEAIMFGDFNIEDILEELKNPNISKEFSDDLNKMGEGFWDWLIKFHESGGRTFGIFDS